MSHEDIIRAWKDEEYRNSLSEEQRAQLPENPAGMIELSDEAMQNVAGGGAFSLCWGRTKKCFLKPDNVIKTTIEVCPVVVTAMLNCKNSTAI
jgi:mersacidin/lichenicidin family type 2 lantibiotic